MSQKDGAMSEIKKHQEFLWLEGRLRYYPANLDKEKPEEIRILYPDGKIKARYLFLSGKLNGISIFWYLNGTPYKEMPYKEGKLHGLVREWYPNGAIKSEISYEKGIKQGICRFYFENGKIQKECFYNNGILEGTERRWYPNGNLQSICQYKNGLCSGWCQVYSEDGKIIEKKFYLRGVALSLNLKKMLDKNKLTAQRIIKIKNTAVRRVLLEEFGYERFLAQMPHQIIDKNGEEGLVKIDWHKDEEPIFLIKIRFAQLLVYFIPCASHLP